MINPTGGGGFDKQLAAHLLEAEQNLRLLPTTQELYRKSRSDDMFRVLRDEGWLIEDEIQRAMIRMHGANPDLPMALDSYRNCLVAALERFPELKEHAFFTRLNIAEAPIALSTIVPRSLKLFQENGVEICMGDLMDMAIAARKLLVLFVGSIT